MVQQAGFVGVEGRDIEPVGRHETVSRDMIAESQLAAIAELDAGVNRNAVENAQNGLQRADIPQIALAPAHRFLPGQFPDGIGDKAGQHGGGIGSFFLHHRIEKRAFVRLAFLDLRAFGQGAFEPGHRLLWRIGARAAAFLPDIGLFFRQTIDDKGQTARRRMGLGEGKFKPGALQPLGDQPFQIVRRPFLHARRNFLRKQFDQEFRHHSTSTP